MARIRTIKPDFFASEDVAELPLRARLTWIGLWTQADDHGRWKDNAKLVKAAIWPLDATTLKDVESDLNTLADCGRIIRYQDGAGRYLAITGWHRHQAINRPGRAKYPAPPESIGKAIPGDLGYCEECATGAPSSTPSAPLTEDSLSTHGGLTEDSHQERKGKDQGSRKGRVRAGALPDSWRPNQAHSGFAADNRLKIDHEAAQFRDYHLAKGSTMKDWDAAFRTWLRNAVKWSKPESTKPARMPDTPIDRPPIIATDEEISAWYAQQRQKANPA